MQDLNRLKYLSEFAETLKNYQLSPESLEILKQTKLVLLIAPSSTGRNAIIRELVKNNQYYFIVSDTTRKPRVNDGVPEKRGVHYWFRSEAEVLEDLRTGRFLEAAVIHDQQVSGISIRELKKAQEAGKIAITDIEPIGAKNILKSKPDTLALFILPPSFGEWMRRLEMRGFMDPGETGRRLESAQRELKAALIEPYYYFVINDTVSAALAKIDQFVRLGVRDEALQAQGRKLAEQLLEETQKFLAS